MNTHGLDQSEALTRAAQKLSAAKSRWEESKDTPMPHSARQRLLDVMESAEMAYKAAYKAYTNPFGVVKTV